MPKRKRTEAVELRAESGEGVEAVVPEVAAVAVAAQSEAEPAPVDTGKLASKLHHHLRVLRATAKRARTFETQRTVKRLKAAKTDEERNDLEAELTAFKTVDIAVIAARALLMKCAKSRLLPKHKDVNEEVEENEAVTGSFPLMAAMRSEGSLLPVWTSLREKRTAEGGELQQDKGAEKVQARLASSKMMAEEVGRVVQEMQQIINPARETQASNASKGKEREKEPADESPAKTPKVDESRKVKLKDSEVVDTVKAKKARTEGSSSKGPIPEPAQIASKEIVDEDMDEAEDQDIEADDSGDEDSVKGGADLGDEDGEDDADINSDVYDNQSDASDDEDDDGDPRNLPTLSSGFVSHGLSFRDRGSDDEWSGGSDDEGDIDENAAESAAVGADGKKKSAGKDGKVKNRPGQRARQALWEKKYGRNARHIAILKREPRSARQDDPRDVRRGGARPDVSRGNERLGRGGGAAGGGVARSTALSGPAALKRDEGWASSRGQALAPQPRSDGPTRGHRPPPPPPPSSFGGRPSAGPAPTPSKPAATTTPHPSWVAKQKQKEQMSQALSLKPAGKKVVFD
ncbi:unnamed protein product [Tilletia controversa]|uniref:Bud22 domain-containing protein n=3 Tax=Tilletia TaxID=13289 RepID=A0A8X7SV19_9BASI|nr:hypothetical protein CF335_g7713 [Tilletia laevis]KAE8191461.1 hypothetical protein CF328_g5675 [Tilletia controversa]KAE8255843.1 hypothetical protein A4X03_0g5501 [Tilletia caries]KAE8189278.1 hypothetical protein CF336_g5802 [Tilletia laevis]KAE8243106.1 hypothetical protein A4X06_0g6547 [Tilletia controversa]